MSTIMQSFALHASKTLHTGHAEDCPMPKKKDLPATKLPVEDLKSLQTFSRNVKALLAAAQTSAPAGRRPTQEDMAKAAGISLRSLKYQINGTHAPTLRTVELIATSFDLEVWQLFLPDLPTDIVLNPEMRQKTTDTVKRYLADADLRAIFERITGRLEEPSKIN